MERWHTTLSQFWIFGQYLGYTIKSKLPLFLVFTEFIYNFCIIFVSTAPFNESYETHNSNFYLLCIYCIVEYTPSWCIIIVSSIRIITVKILFKYRRSRTLWIEAFIFLFCTASISIPVWNIYLYTANPTSVFIFSIQIVFIVLQSISLLFNRERARKRAAIWRDWNFRVSNRITLPTLSGSGYSFSALRNTSHPTRLYQNCNDGIITPNIQNCPASAFYPLKEEPESLHSYTLMWPQYFDEEGQIISQPIKLRSTTDDEWKAETHKNVKGFLIESHNYDDSLQPYRYINIGDVLVNFKLEGSGKRLFCFIHQFGASLFTWRYLQKELSKYGVTLSYDRIAHGFSSRPPADISVLLPGFPQEFNPYSEQYTIYLSLFLVNLFGQTFHPECENFENIIPWHPGSITGYAISTCLIACSIGCSIAIECAILKGDISCLVLISPSIYSEGFPGILRAVLRTEVGRSLTASIVKSELTDFMLKRAYYDHSKLNHSIIQGYEKPLEVAGWQDGFSSLFKYFKPMKVYERLQLLKVPLLILVGQNDRITPPREFQRLRSDLDFHKIKYTFESIPNCGNLPHEEQPELVMQKIKEFISTLESI